MVTAGSNDKGQVQLTLVNVTSPGTYTLQPSGGARQYAFCQFIIGNPLAPTAVYSTSFANGTGTIIIESLTDNNMKGTFTADCTSSQGRVTQIRNGRFKVEF
jgi:hypothetical protein